MASAGVAHAVLRACVRAGRCDRAVAASPSAHARARAMSAHSAPAAVVRARCRRKVDAQGTVALGAAEAGRALTVTIGAKAVLVAIRRTRRDRRAVGAAKAERAHTETALAHPPARAVGRAGGDADLNGTIGARVPGVTRAHAALTYAMRGALTRAADRHHGRRAVGAVPTRGADATALAANSVLRAPVRARRVH